MLMRNIMTILVLTGLLVCFSDSVSAQKLKKSKSTKSNTTSVPVQPDAAALLEKRAAAQKISIQLKGLTQFLYVFGGVTKSFESVEEATETNNVSVTSVRKTEHTRSILTESIRTIQGNLEQLENDFSGKSNLRPYYHFLIGASRLAAQSEKQIQDGQMKEAGQSLIKVANQLTEALVGMQD